MIRIAWRSLLLGALLIEAGGARAEAGGTSEVDRAIDARAGGPSASRSSDAEFARRLYLDLAGRIPTADEARAFLAEADAAKRDKLIDRLLAGPDFPNRMEQAWTAMLLERRSGKEVPLALWSEFLSKAFAANEPWDGIVRAILRSDGREAATRGAMKFLADRGQGDRRLMTEDVARLLLGKNYGCARCHNHLTIHEFKQADFMGISAYLGVTRLQEDSKAKQFYLNEGLYPGKAKFTSVLSKKSGETGPRLPGAEEVDVPVFEKGQEWETPPSRDRSVPGIAKFRPRTVLAEDLVKNRQFARNSVNRFWFLLMGRGLIHPLDMDHPKNPPSHPELLESLTDEFIARRYDVKHLVRKLVRTEAYQRSSLLPPGAGKAVPPESYRVALARPLSPEQLAWSLRLATGKVEAIPKAPPADAMAVFTGTFANQPGEPEVAFEPTSAQALFLMNDKVMLRSLEPQPGSLTDRLEQLKDAPAIAEELYVSVLARLPDEEEKGQVQKYLEQHPDQRKQALGELAWALLASAEFRLNH